MEVIAGVLFCLSVILFIISAGLTFLVFHVALYIFKHQLIFRVVKSVFDTYLKEYLS